MGQVASILGLDAEASDPMVAVVRCNGSCEHRPRLNTYDGPMGVLLPLLLWRGRLGTFTQLFRL